MDSLLCHSILLTRVPGDHAALPSQAAQLGFSEILFKQANVANLPNFPNWPGPMKESAYLTGVLFWPA